jgi:hypothetical protein
VDASPAVNEQRSMLEGQVASISALPCESIVPKGGLYIPSLDGIRAVSFSPG